MKLNEILTLTDSTISEMSNDRLQEALKSIDQEQFKLRENIFMKGGGSSSDHRVQDQLTRTQGQCMAELGGRGVPVNSKGQKQSGHYGQGVM